MLIYTLPPASNPSDGPTATTGVLISTEMTASATISIATGEWRHQCCPLLPPAIDATGGASCYCQSKPLMVAVLNYGY